MKCRSSARDVTLEELPWRTPPYRTLRIGDFDGYFWRSDAENAGRVRMPGRRDLRMVLAESRTRAATVLAIGGTGRECPDGRWGSPPSSPSHLVGETACVPGASSS